MKKLRHLQLRRFDEEPAQTFRVRMPDKDARQLPWNGGPAQKPGKAARAAARRRRAEEVPARLLKRPDHDEPWWVERRALVLAAGRCAWCGGKKKLTVDHIVPLSKGGSNRLSNLQCLCVRCNKAKGDQTGIFSCAP